MKKNKSVSVLISSIVILFSLVSILSASMNVQADTAIKIKEVTKKVKSNDVKDTYSIIYGLDSHGQKIWKYKSGRYYITELGGAITYKVYKNRVYIFDDGKLVIINKRNGKKIYVSKGKVLDEGSPVIIFDSKGNIYAQPYYSDNVYKLSANGKLLWKTNIRSTNQCWPGKMKLENGKYNI